jgi:hypothetical protein
VAEHLCIDCLASDPTSTNKPVRKIVMLSTPNRCATHQREVTTRRRKQSRARTAERTYGISPEDNHELFLYQNGRCWLCQKATGATKSLAVDHDHQTDEVRGRLCGPCNQFIGKLGDDPEKAANLLRYLQGDTPYRRMKAIQTLQAGREHVGPAYPRPADDARIVMLSVADIDGELFADWFWEGAATWSRNLVRRRDGVWSVTRE